jgi:hypothetical protein
LDLSAECEFAGRPEFDLAISDDAVKVGDQVVLLGFPLMTNVLTSHIGYISASFRSGAVHRLQIDASVNLGNSGGPLVHVNTGQVIGIVTRVRIGLNRDFENLIATLDQNLIALSNQRASISIGGIDPIQATRSTVAALRVIAVNLRRSANVGIGWAYCSEHIVNGEGFSK